MNHPGLGESMIVVFFFFLKDIGLDEIALNPIYTQFGSSNTCYEG